ncbi:MAG: hypothetical protein GY771_02195 [bacterium]|nr:hypothetical protein [bacterium]
MTNNPNSLNDDFWERAAVRPKKEGIIELAHELDEYIIETLGERIDDVQERGKAEGIAYISRGREILLINIGLRFLRIYVHPAAGVAFAPDEVFEVERFNFWESSFRKTTGKYVGMTVWVSEREHMAGMKGIINRISRNDG